MAHKLRTVLRNITASEVRLQFLDYFKVKGHQFVPSTSVLCGTGHGTYFTNAGMNQFRSIFESESLAPNHPMANVQRAVNTQRCIRMNDLGDVGRDGYHHTLFEMLGTWAFGLENKSTSPLNRLSGKQEAIRTAWELLTNVYGIDSTRLTVTYFGGDSDMGLKPDLETREIWLELGLPAEKIIPAGSESNFWTMGDMGGPCGPCTEIHYTTGAPPGSPWPADLELWNIVFISYSLDGNGNSRRLPRSHIDTGLGLERLTAVLNNKRSNYGSDVFTPIFKEIETLYKLPPYEDLYESEADVNFAYRVIADHARMASVSLADGVLPSNRDLGHKVRSVLTRAFGQIAAIREDSLANLHKTFPLLAKTVLENSTLYSAFPELFPRLPAVISALENEALRFVNAWNAGKKAMNVLRRDTNFVKSPGKINHEIASRLLDGSVPSMSLELLVSLAKSYQLQVDVAAVKHLLAKEQSLKQQSSTGSSQHSKIGADTKLVPPNTFEKLRAQQIPPTCDLPQYEYLPQTFNFGGKLARYKFPPCEASVLAVFPGIEAPGSQPCCWVVFDRTNLYPSNLGGQACDFGIIEAKGMHYPITMVQQVGTFNEAYILHRIEAPLNSIARGNRVRVHADEDRRQAIMRAHTACHLTMAAVRAIAKEVDASKIFISGTMQAGSAVDPDRFTVDIQTPLQLTDVELISKTQAYLNSWLNGKNGGDFSVKTSVVPVEEAFKNAEIIHLPNEEYPPMVRLVKVGEIISQELCCGTHVLKAGDIGAAVILSATGGRQGVKRFTVITGQPAFSALDEGTRAIELLKRIKTALELEKNDLNPVLRDLAAIRRLVDSPSLPRVVRDQIEAELDGLNRLAISKSGIFVEKCFQDSSLGEIVVAPFSWRSLRTETTRSIVRSVVKQMRQKSTSLKTANPVIFVDTPSNEIATVTTSDRPIWVMCALPHSPPEKKAWDEIIKDFRLRTDNKKDPKWLLVDGALPNSDTLNEFQNSIERIVAAFRK